MDMIINILICFAAFSVGSVLSVCFIFTRAAKPIVRYPAMIAISAIAAIIAFFAVPDSAAWTWSMIVGYLGSLFTMSLCIVSGDEEAYAATHHNEMKGCA